jgi:hypothetical protein
VFAPGPSRRWWLSESVDVSVRVRDLYVGGLNERRSEPLREVSQIDGRIAFFNEQADPMVDGTLLGSSRHVLVATELGELARVKRSASRRTSAANSGGSSTSKSTSIAAT